MVLNYTVLKSFPVCIYAGGDGYSAGSLSKVLLCKVIYQIQSPGKGTHNADVCI